MNERILQLAELAEDWADSQNFYASDYRDYLMEKFAQLIVEECASLFERQYTDQRYAQRIDKTIKKHFGVEK
jgi:hypothetical protein